MDITSQILFNVGIEMVVRKVALHCDSPIRFGGSGALEGVGNILSLTPNLNATVIIHLSMVVSKGKETRAKESPTSSFRNL